MPTAHLIHGFVGNGKTTYAIKLEKALPALRFSIDEWIAALYGQNPPREKFEEYHHRTANLIWSMATRALTLGQDIVLDFGFWSRASREDARKNVEKLGAEVVFYRVTCADEVMRTRVSHRTAQMPKGALQIDENALREFSERFEPMGADEPHRIVRTDSASEAVCVSAVEIRDAAVGQADLCEPILRSLPEWFGIESALQTYVESINVLPTFVAVKGKQPIGFLTVKQHNEYAAEIFVMAVHPNSHRLGIGRRLVGVAERAMRDRGIEYFQVKTLGTLHPDHHYAATRKFYRSVGFKPLEEFANLWPETPCLQMIKRLPHLKYLQMKAFDESD